MNKYFSGKEIKELSKKRNFQSLVFEFNGSFQAVEFFNRDRKTDSEQMTRIEIKRDFGIERNRSFRFCYLYAGSNNTTWQFFVKSLKNTDSVHFYIRNDSSTWLNEKGLVSQSLRAVVTSFSGERIINQKELTVQNQILPEHNNQCFFKSNLHLRIA